MTAGTAPTRYVDVGGADVAYRCYGDGPIDILYCFGLGSHVDMMLEDPADPWVPALARLGRLIAFDRRGTGASDALPDSGMPTWEQWADDIAAVLDAVGSETAVLFAAGDAGPIAIRFAASRPDRVTGLVLENTMARFLEATDYPAGNTTEAMERLIDLLRNLWGSAELMDILSPSGPGDPTGRRRQDVLARRLRASATPRTAAAQLRYIMTNLDVRDSLNSIQAPTLILHTAGNPIVELAHARYLAEHIRGARLVELPGAGVGVSPDAMQLAAEAVAELVTGERMAIAVDRILTTIMFTDIVGSTEHLRRRGDKAWAQLLDGHDRVVREQLRTFRGTEIDSAGDGFFVSFDGPGRGLRCARAIVQATRELGLEVRIGMHTGECEVRTGGLAGFAVHVAARVGAAAVAGQILVSSTLRDLVQGSGIEFDEAGQHTLKGLPGTWELLAVRCESISRGS